MLHHIITAIGLLLLTYIAEKQCFAQPWMPVPPFLLMHPDYYLRDSGPDLDQFYQPAMVIRRKTFPPAHSAPDPIITFQKPSGSQLTSKRYYTDQERVDLDIQLDTSAATTVVPDFYRPYQQPAAHAFSQFVPNTGGGAVMTNCIPESNSAKDVWSADLIADGSKPPMAHEYPSPFPSNQVRPENWNPNDQSNHQMSLQMRRRISTGRERPRPGFQSVTNEFVPDQQSSMRDYVVNMGQRLNGGWRAYPTKKMYYSPINDDATEQQQPNRGDQNSQAPRFAMSNMFDPVGTPYDNGGFTPNNQIPWSPPPEPRPMPYPERRMDYDEQFYNMNRQPDSPPNEMDMPPFDPSGQFPFPPPVDRPRPRYSPRRGSYPVRHPGQPLRILEPAVPTSEFNRRFALRDKSMSRPEKRKRPQRIKGAAQEDQFEPGYGPVTKLRRWLYETSKLAGSSHGGDNSTSSASDTVNGISEPGYGPPPSNINARSQAPTVNSSTERDKRSNLQNL